MNEFEQEQLAQFGQQTQFEQQTQPRQPEPFEQSKPFEQSQSFEQPGQSADGVYSTPDVYQSQTEEDLYRTPEIHVESYDTGGVFSGEQAAGGVYGNDRYGTPSYENQPCPNTQYGEDPSYGKKQYGIRPYGNGPYGNGQYGNNFYGNGPYGNEQYGNSSYGNGQYGNNFYGNGPYGNEQYGNSSYGNGQYGNSSYGNGQYGNNACGNGSFENRQYGKNPYGSPYGAGQYPYSPYSPYAAPPGKKHTGLIIGIIIGIIVLFLIALLTLLYHTIETLTRKRDAEYLREFYKDYFEEDYQRDDYDQGQFPDDREKQDDADEGDGSYENADRLEDGTGDDDPGYDMDTYDYDADEYYTLHDDIRDLSYSIEWEDYAYDTDEENVSIMVEYPIIVGSHVPNLDKINDIIAGEVSVFTEYYEEEYSGYMEDESSYFNAYAAGYVTFMSEDVLSVVFSEYVYTDYFDSIYLYSINVDMQNGVILDNTDIITVDDDFSVDFRYRSDEQNGSVEGLEWMTDQDITQLLSSEGNLIIFYTPQGMEIGFNYDEGWVTVTYHDYKDFLKIF